jgi:hypothetical protein
MKTPTMTRAHFVLIADTLRQMRPNPGTEGFGVWRSVVAQFRLELNRTNPLFDGERFMRAAGYYITEGEIAA